MMKTRRISDLIKVADQGGIVLPDFQRSFKYGFEKQQNLLASLLSGIPLGSVLTLQGAANTFSHRKIGRRDDAVGQVVSQNEAIFLLDGQQRLTSLWFALTDVYHGCQGTDAFNALYDKLATNLLSQRWFLRFRVEEGQEDIWGYNY